MAWPGHGDRRGTAGHPGRAVPRLLPAGQQHRGLRGRWRGSGLVLAARGPRPAAGSLVRCGRRLRRPGRAGASRWAAAAGRAGGCLVDPAAARRVGMARRGGGRLRPGHGAVVGAQPGRVRLGLPVRRGPHPVDHDLQPAVLDRLRPVGC